MVKDDLKLLKDVLQKFENLSSELEKKIIGQKEIIDFLFIILLAKGHGLMIGVPGLAKTLLIKSLSSVLFIFKHLVILLVFLQVSIHQPFFDVLQSLMLNF